MRESVDSKKLKAVRRAQFRLKQTLERIDWEEEVLFPEVEALEAGGRLELEASEEQEC